MSENAPKLPPKRTQKDNTPETDLFPQKYLAVMKGSPKKKGHNEKRRAHRIARTKVAQTEYILSIVAY